MSSSSYPKLTVPQLKALCKDRKLAGYSKLGKAALIQKLVEAESAQGSAGNAPATTPHPRNTLATVSVGSPVSNATDVVALVVVPPAISVNVSNEVNPTPVVSMEHALATQKTTANDESTSTSVSSSIICSSLQPPTNTPGCIPTGSSSSNNVLSSTSAKPSKRAMPPPPHVPQSKRVKVQHPITNRPRISGQPTKTNHTSGAPIDTEGDRARAQNTNTSETSSKGLLACGGSRVISSTLAKPHSQDLLPPPRNISRFKPLVPSRNANIPGVSLTARNAIPGKVASSAVDLSSGTLLYLDLPPLGNPPRLKLITLPPPLSQRKRVQCWAIILRDLDDASRKQCVLVSRTIRYAVYLSAAHILKRRFHGTRLINDTKQYSRDMINFWPYLCFRLDEVQKRKRIYARSFLAQLSADKKIAAISEELWGSPESERQLTIALRFVLTRFWFALSLGGEGSEYWLGGVVLDAQQVVEGEIWRISMLHPGEREDNVSDFYVLEATCEVIGLSSERSATSTGPNIDMDRRRRTACLRADWSSYVQRHITSATKPRSSVLGSIKWAHFEEYERGISRLWLKRTAAEGGLGRLKRTIAERYILACVVGNSVSGTQMTTTEMAQDPAGMPSRHGSYLIKRTPDLNLFLPAHHHVESIHFMTASKKPLHPALAIVQTPDREYFVLKDNGMEVGCEETGVAPVWMEVLKCSTQGTSA